MKNEPRKANVDLEYFDDFPIVDDEKIAFIKHDYFEGKLMWMIYDAEGERIAATDNRDFAFIVARQNDLTPQSAH